MAKEAKKTSDKFQLVEVLELYTVSPGVLFTGLSDDQYRRRKNRMIQVKGKGSHSEQSIYRSDQGLQFKVGERLMLEYSDIDKAQRAKLNLVD